MNESNLHEQCLSHLRNLEREGRVGLKFKLHWSSDTREPTVDGWAIYDDSGFSLSSKDVGDLSNQAKDSSHE